MKTIIIPTDFSPAATCAMNYGVDMAKIIGASVLLFHVYNVPAVVADVPVLAISTEKTKTDAEAFLASLKEKLEHITSGQVKIDTEAVLGDVQQGLDDVCKRVKPFAVVMGSCGSTGLERMFFGSTTVSAVRHLVSPVIAVPIGTEYGMGIRKIGFACDFRDVEETTPTDEIKSLVKELNAELHVLNVDQSSGHPSLDTTKQIGLLKKMLEDLKPVYHFIENKDVEDGINHFAETNNLDLILIIPKKQKLMENFFKVSSAKQMIFHSHIPVMCIHEESGVRS
jgi:nucleotide-binding universal stress UspA family protein